MRAATITFKVWQEGATIRGRLLFEGGYYSRVTSDRGNTVLIVVIGSSIYLHDVKLSGKAFEPFTSGMSMKYLQKVRDEVVHSIYTVLTQHQQKPCTWLCVVSFLSRGQREDTPQVHQLYFRSKYYKEQVHACEF